MKRKWIKSTGLWTGRVLLSLLILFALAIGFGTPSGDAEKMRAFSDAVEKWQHNPEFRQAQIEYVEMGSDAMRTKACWVDTTKGIMWLRSIPGLPPHLRVNDTSLTHYSNFTKGPLSAYMQLTGEQGLVETAKMLRDLGQKQNLSNADVVQFLKQYKMDYPVVCDAGAVKSVRELINDVDPGRSFEVLKGVDVNDAEQMKARSSQVKSQVAAQMLGHIARVAKKLGYPEQIAAMTPEQQLEVWQFLDDDIKQNDYEFWRLKQVNDWLNGVWAQVYGTMYGGLITPTLRLREFGRIAGPLLLMAWVGAGLWKRRKESRGQTVPATLALDGAKPGTALHPEA